LFCGLIFLIPKEYKTAFLFICFLLFAIVSGIRAEDVGIDTIRYFEGYERIAKGYETSWEIFYVSLNELTYHIYDAPEVAIFFASLLTMFIYFISFRYYSINYALSFAIFLGAFGYFTSFNLVRQSIAIGIVSLAFIFLRDKKYLFVVLILVASGFHASAVLMLPMLFLAYVKIDDRFIVAIIGFWLFSIFLLLYPKLTYGFINLFGTIVGDAYRGYLTAIITETSVTVRVFLNQLFFIAGIYVLYYRKCELSNKERYIIILSLLGIIALNITHHLYLVQRIAYYLYLFIVFSLPMIIFKLFKGWQLLLVSLSFYFFYFINFIRAIANNANGVNPYLISEFWKL
jgi:transmembrane protein EpsG